MFWLFAVALAGWLHGALAQSTLDFGAAPNGEVEDYALSIQPAADLRLDAPSIPANQVDAGSNATLTVSVTNQGPSTATGVTLVNRLSSHSVLVSATATQGTCANANGVVTCNFGNLAAGARATATLVLRVGAGTNTTSNSVTANEFDPNLTNNTAAASIVGTFTLPAYDNTDAIVLPLLESGPGSIYPANIVVSGLTSSVYKVSVTLHNLNHDYPDDIDVILVGPHGQAVYLMSDCGLDNPLVDVTITLDDDAPLSLPDSDPPIVSGTYKPTNFGTASDAFPAPAPPLPYLTNLSVFRGSDPNGTWSLYMIDDQPENGSPNSVAGFLADGWSLTLVSADPMADLVLTQSGRPSTVMAGEPVSYHITVTNRGPSSSTAVVQDVLPPGVILNSATVTRGGCVNNNGTIICSLGTLPSGAGAEITLNVTPTLGGQATNLVTATGNQLELHPLDNSATVLTTIVPVADLLLAMTRAPGTSLLGQPISYLLRVTNLGPSPATSVALTNELPSGMTLVSVIPGQGACANVNGTLNCNLGSLAAGAQALVQITGIPGLIGVNSNFAIIAAAELDPVSTNNTAAVLTPVSAAADLAITSVSAPPQLAFGQDFQAVLTVSNRGPSSSDVLLIDTFPSTLDFISATSTRGSCSQSGGGVQCNLGVMAAGESAVVTLLAHPTTIGLITNRANVTGSASDPMPADNTATNVTSVTAAADLVLAINSRANFVWIGEDLLYTLAVTNRGQSAASNVQLTNLLPPGVTFISATPSQGSCTRNNSELSCNLGSLPNSAAASIALLVHPTLLGPLTNTAVVGSELFDPAPANNRAVAQTRVIASSGVYSNSAPIQIPRMGAAAPYPATIFVSGLTASVFSVRVTLANLTHTYPDDLDMLLVGPNGRSTLILSDCGGQFGLNDVSLTLGDGAPNALPDSSAIASGLYRPTNYEPDSDPFPAPAPPGPYQTNLAVFTGIDPNGTWSLFIVDDADKDSGLVSGGWNLDFATVEPIADLGLTQTLSNGPFAVSNNLVFLYSVTNRGPATATNVRLTNALPLVLTSLVVSNSQGGCQVVDQDLTCALGNLPAGATATVTVSGAPIASGTASNFVSVGSDLLDLNPADNTAMIAIEFGAPPVVTLQPVSLSVTNGENVQFSGAAIGDEPLLFQWQHNGVDLPGATNSTLSLGPVTPSNAGTYRLRVSNSLGTTFSIEAVLIVFGPPTLSEFSDIAIDENSDTGLLPFTVHDFESPAESLTVFGQSSDPTVVPGANIVFGGSGSNRTVRITPLPDRAGLVTIAIGVRDPDGLSSTNSFLLTIRAVNSPPLISNIPDQSTGEDAPLAVPFNALDAETTPDALLYSAVSSNPALVSGTNIVFTGTGTNRLATITPAPNQAGVATIVLTVTDSNGATASDAFRLTVFSVNDPPAIGPLPDLTIDEDSGAQTVHLAGISSGASNEMQNLTVTAHSSNPAVIPNPAVAYLSPDSEATLTFAPLTNASGPVILTVTVKDGQATNQSFSQSFTVNVTPINDSPSIAPIGDQTTDEDVPLFLPLAVSDPETAPAALTLTATSSDPNLVPNANLVFNGTGANRNLAVLPATNRFGTATITVTVADGSDASANVQFVLTVNPVNDPPTLDAIGDRTLGESVPPQNVPLTGLSPGASNETQSLTISAVSSNPALIPNPSILYTNPNPTGLLVFRPANNLTGTATITVTVDDGQPQNHQVIREFNVTIHATNAAPTISSLNAQSTDEDTPLLVPFTIRDPDTPLLSLTLTGNSTNTSLVASTNLLFSGSGSNRTLLVLPSPNQSGTSLITVRVSDGAATNSTAFRLTVNPLNDPPTLDPISNFITNAIPGNRTYNVNLSGISSGAANETQTLTFTTASTNTTLLPNPTVNYTSGSSTAVLTLRPANNASGVSLVTVTLNDGATANSSISQSFLVLINPAANVLPTLSTITNVTLNEDTSAGPIPFTVRDAETTAASLSVIARSSNPRLLPEANIVLGGTGTNRTVTLTPTQDQFGTANVTLTVIDASAGASNLTFHVTVLPVNDPPTISTIANQTIDQATATGIIAFTVNDLETPAGSLVVSASSGDSTLVPDSGIILGGSGAGRGLLITPATNQSGTATITVQVTDGAATNRTSFLLTVNPVITANHPPTISTMLDVVIDEDTATAAIPFLIRDVETTADALALSVTSSDPALVPTNRIAFGGSGTNRTITLTPEPNQSGISLITLTVTDASNASASQTFKLTVKPVNDPPGLGAIADLLLNENSGPQIIRLAGIGTGAPDEHQSLTMTATASDPGLLAGLTINYSSPADTGIVTFVPVPNTNGAATISVTVNDGQPTNNLTTRTFTVTVNAAPILSDIPDQIVPHDTPTAPIPFTVSDRETPAALLTVTGASSNPTLVPDGNILLQGTDTNRSLVITPSAGQSGVAVISLTLTDTNGAATTNRFVLTIQREMPPIVITGQPQDVIAVAGFPASFSVTASSTLPLSYQWQRNGVDLPGANQPTLSLPSVQSSDAGLYLVLVSNADLTVASSAAQLQVVLQPPVPKILSITRIGPAVNVTFTTVAGFGFTLQYNDTLSAPTWTTVTSQPGAGAVLTLTDPTATVPTRFYRVRLN